MSHSIQAKHGRRIFLITISDPFDFRAEMGQLTEEMQSTIGEITSIIYLIYDIRHLSINFSDIINGVTGLARPQTEFDKQLMEYARMIMVGSGPLISIAAKAAARLTPDKPTLLFATPEEALKHAEAELVSQTG